MKLKGKKKERKEKERRKESGAVTISFLFSPCPSPWGDGASGSDRHQEQIGTCPQRKVPHLLGCTSQIHSGKTHKNGIGLENQRIIGRKASSPPQPFCIINLEKCPLEKTTPSPRSQCSVKSLKSFNVIFLDEHTSNCIRRFFFIFPPGGELGL